jgi:hypothetical protein
LNKPQTEKGYITFNTNPEDTSVMAHTSEELNQRICEAVSSGKTNVVIFYNIMPVSHDEVAKEFTTNIELANENALKEVDKDKKAKELNRIEASIKQQLVGDNANNLNLLFQLAVNRAYANKINDAISNLQLAAKQAITMGSDSAAVFKNKLDTEGSIKLQRLRAERPPQYEAVLYGLANNDLELVTLEMGILKEIKKGGDSFLYLKGTDTYKNSVFGYQISVLGRDAEGNITLKLTLPKEPKSIEQAEITGRNGQVLSIFGQLNSTYNGWNYLIVNESPVNKSYVKLRIKFEYKKPTLDEGFGE